MYAKDKIDYSLYLVTDSTMLPEGTTLYSQVENALKNGVTMVQLREKNLDTKKFIEEAMEVQKICKNFEVPLIINDRIDVALAIDADGVHVGQDDMPIPMVRRLIGGDKIIGWSIGHSHEVDQLVEWGPGYVDYIGIGMVFPTNTKKNAKKSPMGPRGVARILDTLEEHKADWCRTVAIGGVHLDNIGRVLYQCNSVNGRRSVDGISVVSAIMAARDAGLAAKNLRCFLKGSYYQFLDLTLQIKKGYKISDGSNFRCVIEQVSKNKPLVQHITNRVHQNFGANVTLAIGASPIMSEDKEEVKDLANVSHSALLLNTGSLASLETCKAATRAYNEAKRPIVFDPVGYSATPTRMALNDTLLACGQFTCIKGNVGEILSLAGLANSMRGVDACDGNFNKDILIQATREVAYRFRTVAVCTGETDFIADGTLHGIYSLSKGIEIDAGALPCITVSGEPIPLMASITASGCSLGSTIASLLGGANADENPFELVIAAVQLYKEAGRLASLDNNSPGSFLVKLIDELYRLSRNPPDSWLTKAQALN